MRSLPTTPVLLIAAACAAAPALASDAPSTQLQAAEPRRADSDKPWSRGVSEESRQKALEAFRQGNLLLKDSVFVHAAARYRDALQHWDHPAIHYNLVLALLNLDQPVETYEHIEAAMRFGPAALDAEKFEQARAYKAIFEKQISRVDISCEVKGAVVKMDGRDLFVGPGRYKGMVRAGPHTVLASAEGYITNEISRALPAGEVTTIELRLYTNDQLTRYRRTFPLWMQYSAIASGAVLTGGGALLHLQARNAFRSYDGAIRQCALENPAQGGCLPTTSMTQQLRTGRLMQTSAFGGYAVGGALLVGGVALMVVNTATPYRITVDELERERQGGNLTAAPFLAPGAGGLTVAGTF